MVYISKAIYASTTEYEKWKLIKAVIVILFIFKEQFFFTSMSPPKKKKQTTTKPLAYFCCLMYFLYCNKSNNCLETPLLHATKEENLPRKLWHPPVVGQRPISEVLKRKMLLEWNSWLLFNILISISHFQ